MVQGEPATSSPTTLLHPSHHTPPPLPPYTSTSSEWCMRTHYICHPTVLFTALSHIPSPLLHTSPSHHTSHTPPHLPHSSPLPIHLPHTTTHSHTPIAANTFFSRMHFLCLEAFAPSMNTTQATNTRANSSLSHESKTRSPLPLPPQ